MRPAFLLLALALASPAFGQSPTPSPPPTPKAVITAPAYVYAGDPIVLFADQSVGGNKSWQLIGSTATFKTFESGVCLVLPTTLKGTYRFALFVAGPTTGSSVATYAEVPVIAPGDPTPIPTPDPNIPPTPVDPVSSRLDSIGSKLDAGFAGLGTKIDSLKPTPTPVPTPTPPPAPPAPAPTPTYSKPAFVTLVIDSSTLTQPVAALRSSPTLAASVSALNAHWITLDVQDQAEYSRRGLATAVSSAGGCPCLIIQGSPSTPGGASSVIASAKLPADEASTLAYIKTALGVK